MGLVLPVVSVCVPAASVHTGCGAHTDGNAFPGTELSQREVEHSPALSVEVRDKCSPACAPKCAWMRRT
jgi:hypothetical protein